MKSLKGTLKQSTIGMGGYVLQSNDGKSYSLHGEIPKSLIGKKVEVTGHSAMSMMMLGEAIEVTTIRESKP